MRALILTTGVLLIGQQALLYLLQPMGDEVFFHYYTTPLIFAPFFAIGFVIHRMGDERSMTMLPATIGLLTGLMVFSLIIDTPLFRSQLAYMFLMAIVTVTVLCAYRSNVPAKLIGTAAFLGNISYSLYLTHWIAERGVRLAAHKLGIPLAGQFILYAVTATVMA